MRSTSQLGDINYSPKNDRAAYENTSMYVLNLSLSKTNNQTQQHQRGPFVKFFHNKSKEIKDIDQRFVFFHFQRCVQLNTIIYPKGSITYKSINNPMYAGRKIGIILATEECRVKRGTTHINPSLTEVSASNVRPRIA
jgi:hypothetical protein